MSPPIVVFRLPGVQHGLFECGRVLDVRRETALSANVDILIKKEKKRAEGGMRHDMSEFTNSWFVIELGLISRLKELGEGE
jgi:hypothetical protein